MKRGLVFGKFYPFHVGHEALIRFARQQCDELIVLACISDKELLPEEQRLDWIRRTFAGDPGILVQGLHYKESELPNSSVASVDISRMWSKRFQEVLPKIDVLCTGEDYGDYVAAFMGCRHIKLERQGGVSGTKIRQDLRANWEDLNVEARLDLLTKVVILGTESSGKSTLAKHLAEKFGGELVAEAGRDLVPDSAACTYEDLQGVAAEHARRIEEASRSARRLLVMDTDIHITMSYSKFLFGRDLEVPPKIVEQNRGHLYLYLDNDAPYVQDGTRLDEARRNDLNRSHRRVLDEQGVEYHVLHGSWEDKFAEAERLVELALGIRCPWADRIALPPRPLLDSSELQRGVVRPMLGGNVHRAIGL